MHLDMSNERKIDTNKNLCIPFYLEINFVWDRQTKCIKGNLREESLKFNLDKLSALSKSLWI